MTFSPLKGNLEQDLLRCWHSLLFTVIYCIVKLQAVWALGNVAGDSPRCRDLVLANGALIPLLHQLNEHAKLSMLRNATWTLSNFCRGKPQPAFEQVWMLYDSFAICKFKCAKVFFHICMFPPFYRHVQLFLHLNDSFIQMMRRFLLMHAGHFLTCLMAQMTRSKLSSKLAFALGLWNFFCMYIVSVSLLLLFQ